MINISRKILFILKDIGIFNNNHGLVWSQRADNLIDDYSVLGGLREINRRNLIPGKDISITGYDGIMLTSMLNPPLTTYEQNGQEIGAKMAEALIKNIEDSSDFECHRLFVSGRLIRGGTVAEI